MKLNKKYCKLLDLDFGYDNKSLSDKIELIADDFAAGFAEWLRDDSFNTEFWYKEISIEELLEIYKKENGL
jgi:hypothetical protein